MASFVSTYWGQITATTWGMWYGVTWYNIVIAIGDVYGGTQEEQERRFKKLPKNIKESIITVKLMMEGYDKTEINKKIEKGIKATIEDLEFVKKNIEISNIQIS